MRARLLRGFFLGDVLVEPLKGQMTGSGSPVKLQPEVVDTLLHLASSPNESIPENELVREVWGRGHGSTDLLEQAIAALRKALDDAGADGDMVEAVPGEGYRLSADVRSTHFPEDHKNPAIDPLLESPAKPGESGFALVWKELKKRRVVRVGIGYLVAAWLVLQVGDILSGILTLPPWSMKLLTVLLACGFVITLAVSWLLQVTPTGIKVEPTESPALRREVLHVIELSVIFVLVISVSVLTYRQFWRNGQIRLPETETAVTEVTLPGIENSIAVLPFRNLGADPADAYFGHGLAEEILHKLVRIKTLKVAARTSSFYYGEHGTDIPTIAARMLVGHVLEGSVRREGQRLRVTAQLVDADGFHLWSRTFDVMADAVLDVQSEIAVNVAREIASNLPPETVTALATAPTTSDEAYNFYLRGLDHLRRPRLPDNLEKAGAEFEKALEIDRQFARAWAALCETELGWYRQTDDVTRFEAAERACNRALTLDPDQLEVHTALGNLYRLSGQYEEGQLHFERALEINPYYEEANYGLAKCLQGQGELEAAEELLKFSIEMEPGWWAPYTSLAVFLFGQGRIEEAIPLFDKVTELTPESPDAWSNLGSAYFDTCDWESADVAWTHSVELDPTPLAYRNMATLYYYQGRHDEAAAMAEKGIELAPDNHWLWGKLGAAARYIEGGTDNSQAAYSEAIRLASERLGVNPEDDETMSYLAAYYAQTGATDKAAEWIGQATSVEPVYPENWFFSGVVNTLLDHPQQAVDGLARAIEGGFPKCLIAADPALAKLHNAEGFDALLD